MNWHPRHFDYDEEPAPEYDIEKDYEAYCEACEERADYMRENRP